MFTTLGGFAVRRGGWEIASRDWARPIDARLVRYFLVHGRAPVPEDVLFEAFWPDRPPERARRSLQVAISRIRALLDPPWSDESTLEMAQGCYSLHLGDADRVDWVDFESRAAAALAGPDPRVEALEHARTLWGGEPLPRERYADWAAAWRERLTQRYLEVLEALTTIYLGHGRPVEATATAQEMVRLDPYDEAAHRALMQAHARSGRRGRALRQYLACRRAMVSDLGVEPTPETSRLHARILAGEAV